MKNRTRNNRLSKTRPGRLLALVLISALLLGMLPSDAIPVSKATEKASHGLNNPTTDSSGVTTWDTVYFGNYWQNDTNGDGTADKNDAKEPIKWRVLSVNGDDAFLLADQNLDCQRYNDTYVSVTWETCTMRSWLNGYGAGSNVCEKDYTNDSFLKNAFSSSEQAAIKNTTVVNADNPSYNTEGGNDTTDKVYLLSIGEVLNPGYGFTSTTENTKTREARNTAYVANGGEIKSGSMYSAGSRDPWWLRSPGYGSNYASNVDFNGYVHQYGIDVLDYYDAVRPALHLNLSSAPSWSYAGTVTSVGGQTTTASPTPASPTPGSGENPDTVMDKSKISITVGSSENLFYAGMEGASVDIEDIGTATTGAEGKAEISNNLSEPSAMKKVTITKDGYRDYIFTTTFVSPELVTPFCTNHISADMKKKKEGDDTGMYLSTFLRYWNEVATSAWGYYTADETVTFRACGVWNDKEPGYYCLYQEGGKSFESTDGVFQCRMKDCFNKEGDIYIKMVAADGTETIEETGIKLAGIGFGSGNTGDSSGIPLLNAVRESDTLNDVPFLNNDKLSFDLGKMKTVIKRDGKKIRIMLGADKNLTPDSLKDDTWEKWKKFCESQPTDLSLSQWKNIVDGAMESSWTGSVKIKLTGYGWLEGEIGESTLRGGIQVILDGSVGFKQQYMVGVIPVYGEQQFGVKGKVDGAVTYDFANNRLGGSNSFTVEPNLSIGGGVGVLYVATVGAEGSASLPVQFSIPDGLKSADLKGSLTLKASVLGFNYSKEMAQATYPLYPGTTTTAKSDAIVQKLRGMERQSAQTALYSMSQYQLPENATEGGSWQGETVQAQPRDADTGGAEQCLQTGISDLTEPMLIQEGDTTMACFLTEDAERSTIQRTKLVYTIYDKEKGTWSEPQTVLEDGTADYLPSVHTSGGQIVISWLNFDAGLAEDATMKDALASGELRRAVWNETKQSFECSEQTWNSSETASYNSAKTVTDSDGSVTMVGLKNSQNDIFGLSGDNILFMNGTYGKETINKTITLTQGVPVSYDAAGGADGITVAVCMDTDRDMATLDDREIYLYSSTGTAKQLTKNSGNDSSPHYAAWNGNTALFWYTEDSYRMMDEAGNIQTIYQSGEALHSDTFTVATGQNGECAIVWTETDSENVRQLMTAIYDKTEKAWTSKVVLTSSEEDIFHPSGYFTSDGKMEFMYRKRDSAAGSTSLCVWQTDLAPELEIADAYIEDGTERPGSKTTIYIGVKNNGTKAVKNYTVSVGGQTAEGTTTILPGEQAVLEADYLVPSPATHQDVKISVEVEGDSNTANNTYTLSTGYADLTVVAKEEEFENGKRVSVNIGNTEALEASAVLEVRRNSEDGELVSKSNLGVLKQGDIVTQVFSYEKDSSGYKEESDKLYYVVTTDTVEKYKSNNYDFSVFSKESDEPEISPSPSPSVSPTPYATETPAVTQKPLQTSSPSPTASPDATKKPGETPSGTGTLPVQPGQTTVTPPQGLTPAVPAVTPGTPSASAPVPAKVTGLKLKAKKNAIQASWKKTTGANGYQLWYSTSKKWKKKKSKTTKKTKLTIGKLKRKKTYFVRVRAYTVRNGKKVYGKWSRTLKKKVK